MTGDNQTADAALVLAARNARNVLRQVSLMRTKVGPLATAAEQAASRISLALDDADDPVADQIPLSRKTMIRYLLLFYVASVVTSVALILGAFLTYTGPDPRQFDLTTAVVFLVKTFVLICVCWMLLRVVIVMILRDPD